MGTTLQALLLTLSITSLAHAQSTAQRVQNNGDSDLRTWHWHHSARQLKAAADQQQQLPACQLPQTKQHNSAFDYYTLTALWPPSFFQYSQSYTAGQLVQQGFAAPGFWMHGLWPSLSQGNSNSVLNCDAPQLQLSDLPTTLVTKMLYWWPGMQVPLNNASALDFWDHEWQKHGTCSGLNSSTYFNTAMDVVEQHLPQLTNLLTSAKLTADSNAPYRLGDIQRVLDAAYGGGYSMTCDNNTAGQLMLSQVEFCLSHHTLHLCDCRQLSDGQLLDKQSSCGDDPQGPIWILGYATQATYGGVSMSTAAVTVIGCLAAVILIMVGVWLTAWQCGYITPLLKLKKVMGVHNPLIHEPVDVLCEAIDMGWLRGAAPGLADVVDDLPAGMAIKGGIARKILKHLYGTPEPPGTFDIDCLVLMPEEAFQPGSHQPQQQQGTTQLDGDDDGGHDHNGVKLGGTAAQVAHQAVTSLKLGALTLEAQDVEVIPKSHLVDYFTSRDITMNEVLILNNGQQYVLFYTAGAKADVQENLVRPSCHMRSSEMQVYWEVDEATGVPYTGSTVVCRCIIRFLKGHGSDYAFDAGTWAHYRRHKLDKVPLFKVLRAFHSDSVQLQHAVDHLVDIGFLRRLDVWRAGGANKMWGLLLLEVNNGIARHGGRLQLGQLDPEGVEKWVTTKKAQTASKRLFDALRARRTGWLASDESTQDLGLVKLPGELMAYVATGAVYEVTAGTPVQDGLPGHADAAKVPVQKEGPPQSGSQQPALMSAPASPANGHPAEPNNTAQQAGSCSTHDGGDFNSAAATSYCAAAGGVWQRFSEVGTVANCEPNNQLGSFYQVLDTEGHNLLVPDSNTTSIITDTDRQRRRRIPTRQLVAFLLSTIRGHIWLYLLACVLLFAGLACQLMVPWVAGQIFDFLSFWQQADFRRMVVYLGALTAAGVVLQSCGQIVLEFAARRVMADLFERLFNHLLAQDPQFFNSISKGELMSRLSGDSLALRALISNGIINLVEGCLITAAVIGVLEWIWSAPYYGVKYFDQVLFISLAFSIVEGLLAAAVANPLNTKTRQATGRMFGFLLDIFSHTDAICGLGLQGMISRSYKAYVTDVFSSTFKLNVFLAVHRSFSLSVMAVVVVLFTYFGGREVIEGTTSIGVLVATLRYIRMQQKGVKQAVDAAVRCWATLGNLERLLQLHDKGTLDGYEAPCLTEHKGVQHQHKSIVSEPSTDLMGHKAALQQLETPKTDVVKGVHRDLGTTAPTAVATDDDDDQNAATPHTSNKDAVVIDLTANLGNGGQQEMRSVPQSPGPRYKQTAPFCCGGSDSSRRSKATNMGHGSFGHGLTLLSQQPAAVSAQKHAHASKMHGGSSVSAGLARQVELFTGMTGGIRLADVSLMVPGRAGRGSMLQGVNLQLLPGEVAVVMGAASEPLMPLLETAMLLNIPYAGAVMLQVSGSKGSEAMQQRNANCNAAVPCQHQSRVGSVLDTVQQGKERQQLTEGPSHSVDPGCWHTIQHLSDYLPAARSNIALVTPQTGEVFRGSLEDNVACAAAAATGDVAAAVTDSPGVNLTHSSIAEVCTKVGLAEEVMLLPDGYRTVIGEGTGFGLSQKATLQLALARALLKNPKLLLVGGIQHLAAAVGEQRLRQILQQCLSGGCAVLMTAVTDDQQVGNRDPRNSEVGSLLGDLGATVHVYSMANSRLQQG